MKTHLIIVATGWLALASAYSQIIDGQFPVTSNLKVGVAKVDITPTDVAGITVVGHRREVTGVRDPLRAGLLILDDGETKAAIVTMDTIGAWEDMVELARAGIEKETGVPAANIMVTASHNHSGPGYVENLRWASELIKKLTAAAKEAAGNMRTVSIGYGEDAISFGINRRKTYDGRAVVSLNPEGPNDKRVKVLRSMTASHSHRWRSSCMRCVIRASSPGATKDRSLIRKATRR
jgi:hypothetical protein